MGLSVNNAAWSSKTGSEIFTGHSFSPQKTISTRTWQKGGGFSSAPTPKPLLHAREPALRSIPLSRCQIELESRLLY